MQAILAVHNTKLSERRSPLAQLQAERAQLSNELQALSKEVEGLGQSLATSQAALTQTLGTSVEIQEQLGKHSGSLAGNAAELGAQHRAACEAVDMARARVGEAEVAVAAAEDAERAGREALLAAQARLSEALQICGALSNHVRQAQANACNAAPMHAERTTRAVANAQAQLGEAQHVVAIAQAEVGCCFVLHAPISMLAGKRVLACDCRNTSGGTACALMTGAHASECLTMYRVGHVA